MRGPAANGSWHRALVGAVGIAVLVLLLLARERNSVERGNRLHRGGNVLEAAAIYRGHVEAGFPAAELHYNLGTSLLRMGNSTATEAELTLGLESAEDEVRARAFYNLGVWSLMRALVVASSDSARAHAAASVEANRNALRLGPERADAKWNLAMAQRMVDSLDAGARRRNGEVSEAPVDSDALVRSENMSDGEEDEPRDDVPIEGEGETLAELEEDVPFSLAEAAEILGTPDAAQIVRKLLGLESRGRWGRQFGRAGRHW